MIVIKCKKCGAYLGSVYDSKNMDFKAKKGITVDGETWLLKCKCGDITEIDMSQFLKNKEETLD